VGDLERRLECLERLEVENFQDLRLTRGLNACRFELRLQFLAERLKLFLRLPDLSDLDVLLVAEGEVEQAPGCGPITGLFERSVNGVVLLPRHLGEWKRTTMLMMTSPTIWPIDHTASRPDNAAPVDSSTVGC
jgi:hypothetical protein